MTQEIDTALEGLAEAYVNAKNWVKMHDRSDVHIVKKHYKDLRDKQEKECWNIEWDNDNDRIDYMDELAQVMWYV